MAVAETRAGVKAAQRYRKLLDFTVTEVNLAKGEAKLRITGIPRDIAEETAKAFNYGKNLAVFRKPLGQGRPRYGPPRFVPDIGELNRIHKQLETQLRNSQANTSQKPQEVDKSDCGSDQGSADLSFGPGKALQEAQ